MAINTGATLAEVVQNLSELTGVNQKADLKAVLAAKGITVLDTDTVADMINKLATSNAVKRWATGTTASITTSVNFTLLNGALTSTVLPYVVVTGLTFKPTYIILKAFSGNIDYMTFYEEVSGGIYPKSVRTIALSSSETSYTPFNIKGDVDPAYVINGGFKLPVQGGYTFKWIAIE